MKIDKNKCLVQEEVFKLVLKTSMTQMSQKCHFSLYVFKINFIKFEIYSLLFLSVKENLMKYPLVIFLLFFSFEIPIALLKKICPREAA